MSLLVSKTSISIFILSRIKKASFDFDVEETEVANQEKILQGVSRI